MKRRYQNLFHPPKRDRHLTNLMRWILFRKPAPWPHFIPLEQKKIEQERVGPGELSVTFINHSTVLIQVDQYNILTDPIWAWRCGPFFGWPGVRRVTPPGVRLEDLPPIDLVIVSHNHYDHMDIPTLKKIYKRDKPIICTPTGNRKQLEKVGPTVEFDWWQDRDVLPRLTLTCLPGEHFSRRGLFDRNKALWGGFMLHTTAGLLYFGSDTGYGPHFTEIKERIGAPRLAMIPIGAYLPRWFMASIHLSPEEAVKAHLDLGAELSMAIHYGTFQLGDEGYDDPQKELHAALHLYEVPVDQFLTPKQGETIRL